MYRVMQLTIASILLTFTFINLADAKSTSVNGKLKDECAYLETMIEEAIKTISKQETGAATGKMLEGYGVTTLISAYKQLCD